MSLTAALECLLFVAGEPLNARALAASLLCDESEIDVLIAELSDRLRDASSGLQVVRIVGGFQLATRPEHAEVVGRLMARGAGKLSRAALETLSIVAYRQPTTMPEIEAVRGVSSAGVIKTLMDRGLVAEAGRKQTVGRPILYETTPEFLHYFGLNDLTDLPPLDGVEAVADVEVAAGPDPAVEP